MSSIKICKKCGAQMDKSAKACPQCGAPAKGKTGCLIGVIAAVVIVIAAAAGSSNNTPEAGNNSTAAPSSASVSSAVSQTEEAKTEESKSEESAAEEAPVQNNIFKVGETLDTGKAKITFQSADDYETDNMFMQPKDGNKYICAYFVVENTGTSDLFTSSADFDCYADDSAADSTFFDEKAFSTAASISPGRKSEGYVWFEVPKNAQKIEIEYEMSWWTQEKAIFIVKE